MKANLDFGFILRMFRSSNNWLVVVVAVFLVYLGIDEQTIGKYVAMLAGVSIFGARIEDAAKKLSGGKK